MTSSRYSKAGILALLAVLVFSVVAAPAAAVELSETTVPDEAEAGTQVSASFTMSNLYQDPNWDPWTLEGETELRNVTWTLTFIDAQGNEFDTRSYDGQSFSQPEITTERDILTVRVEVTGETPPVAESDLTYPDNETFLLAELTQTRGEEGSMSEIGTWEARHYTTGGDADDADPGTQEAREALDAAQAAIDEADEAGADTATANDTFQSAVSAYESGNLGNAVDLANRAEEEANEARESKEQSEQQSQLLLYGAIGVVALLVIVGGVYYWRNQGDDYDKLG
ncbi:MAG: hypothetical protein V5A23_08590 [Halobacteriales archaeon]